MVRRVWIRQKLEIVASITKMSSAMWEHIAKLQTKISELESKLTQLQERLETNCEMFEKLYHIFINMRLDDSDFSDESN